jgi:hypothetical protein
VWIKCTVLIGIVWKSRVQTLEIEIMESGPKMHRAKTALLLKKMKTSPDISWNEKGELQYKGGTVRGLGVFGEYGLIGVGLCCRLRDLGVLLV